MAKENLNIRGDQSIIAAATRASIADVPLSQREMWESWTKGFDKVMKDVTQSFVNVGVVRQGKIDDALSSISDLETMSKDGTLPEDAEAEQAFQDEYETIKNEISSLNPYGDGVKKAKELNRRSDNLIKARKTEQQYAKNILATVKNPDNLVNQAAWGEGTDKSYDRVNALAKFLKGDSDSGISKKFKGNKFEYTFNGEVFSLKDVQDGLVLKDKESLAEVNEIILDIQKSSKENADNPKVGYKQVTGNAEEKIISTLNSNSNSFRTLASERVGLTNTPSFIEALHTQGTTESAMMFTALFELDPSKDTNGDKVVNKEDFVGKDNYNNFVKSVTDPSSKTFDKKLANNLLAKYIVGTVGKKKFDYGKNLGYKAPVSGGGGDDDDDGPNGYFINKQYLTGPAATRITSNIDSLNSKEDFSAKPSWNDEFNFKREDGINYIETEVDGEFKFVKISQKALIRTLTLSEVPGLTRTTDVDVDNLEPVGSKERVSKTAAEILKQYSNK